MKHEAFMSDVNTFETLDKVIHFVTKISCSSELHPGSVQSIITNRDRWSAVSNLGKAPGRWRWSTWIWIPVKKLAIEIYYHADYKKDKQVLYQRWIWGIRHMQVIKYPKIGHPLSLCMPEQTSQEVKTVSRLVKLILAVTWACLPLIQIIQFAIVLWIDWCPACLSWGHIVGRDF